MHIVIFVGGGVQKGRAVTRSLEKADKIFAADSGAETALAWGIIPSDVFGDFDSLSQEACTVLEKNNVPLHKASPEKDETDTELALVFALQHGATTIDILGGVEENRIDHVLANIFFASERVRFINGKQITWVEEGLKEVHIQGAKNDLLSLLPLSSTVDHITTKGLLYPLTDESLPFGQPRGVSNVFTTSIAHVSFASGKLLFVHTLTDREA